jgi:hypothetical protein
MRTAPSSILVAVVVATLWSCRSDHPREERRKLEVYGSDASDSLPLAELGRKQRDLLQALADPNGDPTRYMSPSFTLIDHTDTTAARRRAPDGRLVPGAGFVETLASRLPVEYDEISTMEAFLDRPSLAVMYVRHSSGARSITYWTESAGAWQATLLLVNVDEGSFFEGQRRRRGG